MRSLAVNLAFFVFTSPPTSIFLIRALASLTERLICILSAYEQTFQCVLFTIPPDYSIDIVRNACGTLAFDQSSKMIELGYNKAQQHLSHLL